MTFRIFIFVFFLNILLPLSLLKRLIGFRMEYKETIVGRKYEQKILQACVNSPRAEFIAIYGRRRIGKTYLV